MKTGKISHVDIEKKVYATFADVASSLGYSPLHGSIIGALIVNSRPMSLQELAAETGYSPSMVSLSLDLLEVLGTIKKIKKMGDRKLYISLNGDLLEILKNAIIVKVKKSISDSLADFEESKNRLNGANPRDKKRILKSIGILEKEINRLEEYVNLLADIKLP